MCVYELSNYYLDSINFSFYFPSGYVLLHPLVFVRLFPTLINLYVLHHETDDAKYMRGVEFLRAMSMDKLVRFIGFPRLAI